MDWSAGGRGGWYAVRGAQCLHSVSEDHLCYCSREVWQTTENAVQHGDFRNLSRSRPSDWTANSVSAAAWGRCCPMSPQFLSDMRAASADSELNTEGVWPGSDQSLARPSKVPTEPTGNSVHHLRRPDLDKHPISDQQCSLAGTKTPRLCWPTNALATAYSAARRRKDRWQSIRASSNPSTRTGEGSVCLWRVWQEQRTAFVFAAGLCAAFSWPAQTAAGRQQCAQQGVSPADELGFASCNFQQPLPSHLRCLSGASL